tara:strand:+ start:39 stop:269 length:231 start_codon:yes stop_codon:yes gene_type:complete
MSASFEPVTHAKASMAYVVPGILVLPLLILPYWIASLTFMVFPLHIQVYKFVGYNVSRLKEGTGIRLSEINLKSMG